MSAPLRIQWPRYHPADMHLNAQRDFLCSWHGAFSCTVHALSMCAFARRAYGFSEDSQQTAATPAAGPSG